jgi:hypothetical protein
MTSVPARHSGVASAINNAISRVGSPLVNAVIFVAVAASFYGSIGQQVPRVDTGSGGFRTAVAPLDQPPAELSPEVRAAAQQASTEAFHLAMLVAALLLAGAAVNGVGIRNPAAAGRHLGPGAEQPPEAGSGTPAVRYRPEPRRTASNNHRPIHPGPPDPTDYRLAAARLKITHRQGMRSTTAMRPSAPLGRTQAADESAAQTGCA